MIDATCFADESDDRPLFVVKFDLTANPFLTARGDYLFRPDDHVGGVEGFLECLEEDRLGISGDLLRGSLVWSYSAGEDVFSVWSVSRSIFVRDAILIAVEFHGSIREHIVPT